MGYGRDAPTDPLPCMSRPIFSIENNRILPQLGSCLVRAGRGLLQVNAASCEQ